MAQCSTCLFSSTGCTAIWEASSTSQASSLVVPLGVPAKAAAPAAKVCTLRPALLVAMQVQHCQPPSLGGDGWQSISQNYQRLVQAKWQGLHDWLLMLLGICATVLQACQGPSYNNTAGGQWACSLQGCVFAAKHPCTWRMQPSPLLSQ